MNNIEPLLCLWIYVHTLIFVYVSIILFSSHNELVEWLLLFSSEDKEIKSLGSPISVVSTWWTYFNVYRIQGQTANVFQLTAKQVLSPTVNIFWSELQICPSKQGQPRAQSEFGILDFLILFIPPKVPHSQPNQS